MQMFKITDIQDFPLDEKDHPLDELDMPLSMQISADLDLSNKFDISDEEYDDIDNITPYIDKQMQDTSEEPEDGQYQDEWADEPLNDEDQSDDSELDMDLNAIPGDEEESEEPEENDPNFQGIIRTVKGASLVYKRATEDGKFEELWIANVGNDMKKESLTKRAILAGTDIDVNQSESKDGSESMELWSCGNVQLIKLSGLPS